MFSKGRQDGASLDVTIVDPISDPSWDRLVLSHPDSNIFHRAAWARVLSKTYGHRPVYLQFYRERQLIALVPFMEVTSQLVGSRGVSVPFSDFCEPLVFRGLGRQALIAKMFEIGCERSWRYFQMRGGKKTLPESAISGERYYGHKLDLTVGLDQLFGQFRDPVRRAVRKAEKGGLIVEVSNARKALLDFYRLHVRTRRRHGLPPQPLPFFLHIEEEIMRDNLGFVVLVKKRTTPVAAAVFFHSGKTALFKFGASDERNHDLRANNLVMWEGIKQLFERRLQTLHFGRTSIGQDGLRRFKLSWGTQEEPIEYFKFALRTQMWEADHPNRWGLHTELFRRLPLMVNRMAGGLIYSHLD